MFKSIKTPLTMTVIVAVIFTSAITLSLAIREQKRAFISNEQTHLSALARLSSEVLQPSLMATPQDLADLESKFALFSMYPNLRFVEVYDVQNHLIASMTGHPGSAFFPHQVVGEEIIGPHLFNETLVIVERIGDKAFPLGYLLVASDVAEPLLRIQNGFLLQGLPYVVGSLLFIILLTLWILHRWYRPFYHLTQFTQQVGDSKDYSLRYPHTNKSDTGRLGMSINTLLATIEAELAINNEQNQTLVEQQQTMMRLANYDSLTGLPNRQFVMDNLRLELARAKRVGEDLALLFFDLDGFKGINDSLGHETGDLILIDVADRVTNLLRDGDLIARLGGDEFLIVPDRDVSDTSMINLANRLVQAFSAPFQLRGLDLTVGVSIGIAKATDSDYELSQLMSNADLAMYRSKARGRGTYTVFTVDMIETHKRKMSLANSIDSAILQNEFRLYYQPKVSVSGEIVGLEALIRWNHPDFGEVMPSEFIPIAEQGGKITAITHWVLEQACLELPDLQMMINHRFRLAINLSGHDLRHTTLFDNIHALFERYQVNPVYFEFEVTESAYLENFAFANKFFRRLSNMGCAIALDDFGTGYSSLSYLTQITIDTLKVDRKFIFELETSERSKLVTGTIIDLAKRLSLTVCAEGIENTSQWEYLVSQGCDHVQGFLFSEPVPLDKVLDFPKNYRVSLAP